MALSIPMSYYLLIENKGWTVWVYRIQLILAGIAILLTASRGATLATLVAVSIVPLTQARLTGRQRIALILTVSLLVYGALLFVPSSSWERLSTLPSEFAHGTLTGRTIIWKAGWEIFRAHPFLELERMLSGLSSAVSWLNRFALINPFFCRRRHLRIILFCRSSSNKV